MCSRRRKTGWFPRFRRNATPTKRNTWRAPAQGAPPWAVRKTKCGCCGRQYSRSNDLCCVAAPDCVRGIGAPRENSHLFINKLINSMTDLPAGASAEKLQFPACGLHPVRPEEGLRADGMRLMQATGRGQRPERYRPINLPRRFQAAACSSQDALAASTRPMATCQREVVRCYRLSDVHRACL